MSLIPLLQENGMFQWPMSHKSPKTAYMNEKGHLLCLSSALKRMALVDVSDSESSDKSRSDRHAGIAVLDHDEVPAEERTPAAKMTMIWVHEPDERYRRLL